MTIDPHPMPFYTENTMSKTALITGATAGIGQATAELFAKEGYDVIVTGRRQERLQELKNAIEKEHGTRVLPLCFDVRDRKAVETAIGTLPADWQAIDVLVNNAGLALGTEAIQDGNPADWDVMIDTNIKGLLYVSHTVFPYMIQRQQGHIINLSSIAGKEAYKGGNVYNATKFAVDALNKGMRIDLLDHNIRVTSINPGKVDTEFSEVRFKGDQDRAAAEYAGYESLHAADVAEAIVWAATRPPHVNINELIIMPTAQANTVHLKKME